MYPNNNSKMSCSLCLETNVGPDHDITEKHLKNKTLYEYSLNKKQLSGNRKGIVVSCNVKSTFKTFIECIDAKIKISVKPNEEIKFVFKITNDSKKDEFLVIFVQMAHSKLNFSINNHGMDIGCTPQRLQPKKKFPKDILITFKSSHIGQYEMPIIFSFRNKATNENIVIMRDMVVFVEEKQTVHEKITSPYTQKEVMAQNLYKTDIADHSEDKFRIPKNHKSIYAGGLKVKDDAPQSEQDLSTDIRNILSAGVTKDNYIRFFHNLLWYEETIVRINLKKYNMSSVPLVRHANIYALVVPGLAEKRPSLMLGDLLFVKPHNNEEVMFEGIISDIQDNVIHIQGLHYAFNKYYRSDGRFDIRFFMSRMPLERMHRAVHSVIDEGQETRIFPEANRHIPNRIRILNFYNPLVEANVEQRSVVEHILAGTCGTAPYLLHGPPGTGKTVTIVEAILQLVNKNPKNRILVCTDSNMAADHVAMMLIKYTHMFSSDKLILRANSRFRVWETLPECLGPFSNGTCRDDFQPVSISDFMSYNIVVATLSHSAKFAKESKTKKLNRAITHLFIDEAAQASEPACLIPTCGLLTPRGALVLAGDPLQLGPVVISHGARRQGLGLSLMERLKKTCPLYSDERNDPNYIVMLRNNFRSNPDILEIPNELFYNQQLRALAEEDPISKIDILGERKFSRAVVFHGVLSKEQKMGKSPSFFNRMELEIVQTYISTLVEQHKVAFDDIGVVTPYIRQVYHIKNWLRTKRYDKIEVGTVEAFQGKEKRVIIISTVRANCGLLDHDAKFQLGFLVDDKRFNVALTRAKAKAIIIGNPLCLQKDVKWKAYIQKCRDYGTYYGFDSENVSNEETHKEIADRIMPMLKDLKVTDKSRI